MFRLEIFVKHFTILNYGKGNTTRTVQILVRTISHCTGAGYYKSIISANRELNLIHCFGLCISARKLIGF
jgi:hypothetical protein